MNPTIKNVDCRDGLKALANNSVHLIVTDPPYFLDGMGDDWTSGVLKGRTKNASSQTSSVHGLPASQPFDRKQGVALYEFLHPIFKECFRILVPGGYLISFAQGRLYHRMASAADDAGFEIRDQAIWEHEGGQGKAASQNHVVEKMKISRTEKEQLLQSIDGRKTPQLLPKHEPFVIAEKPREGTFVENWMRHRVGLIRIQTVEGRQRTTVFCQRKPKLREEFDHMTIKPLDLMVQIISTFAPPKATIVDPFLGSGTTGEAAIRLGHTFIGFEKDPQHFTTAQRRFKGVLS